VDLPWTWLHQVHGDRVVTVLAAGQGAGEEADAAVTTLSGAVLAVHTADCAPVALVADRGAVAVAHAGWRGLADGVITAAVDQMRALVVGSVRAVVGPLIGPECYAFGPADLEPLAERLGDGVVGRTAAGEPALDLPAAVRGALAAAAVHDVTFVGGCTACGPDAFSHRARADEGRQAVLAWIEAAP
jgi:YfiH family protein